MQHMQEDQLVGVASCHVQAILGPSLLCCTCADKAQWLVYKQLGFLAIYRRLPYSDANRLPKLAQDWDWALTEV